MRRAAWLAIVAAMTALGLAAQAAPVPIRVGWAVVPANLAPLLPEKPDLAPHLGKSYTLELEHFTGTPQQLQGFAAGEVDLGSFSYSTLALAIENAGLSDLRIVADIMQDGAHGSYSNEFMVLNDGPVQRIEDLRGKVFGTIGGGGSSDIAMRVMLRRHGVDDKTVTFVEVAFPNMTAMLLGGKADIVTEVPPFSMAPDLRQKARTLFTQKDALGPLELLMSVGHAAFLKKNRAAVVDYLEDVLRLQRWLMDPANHDAAVALVASFTKRPPALYQSWAFTAAGDDYRPPDGIPDIAVVNRSIALQHEYGYLKAPLDVRPYVDLSLVKEAAARLARR